MGQRVGGGCLSLRREDRKEAHSQSQDMLVNLRLPLRGLLLGSEISVQQAETQHSQLFLRSCISGEAAPAKFSPCPPTPSVFSPCLNSPFLVPKFSQEAKEEEENVGVAPPPNPACLLGMVPLFSAKEVIPPPELFA